MIQYEIHGLSVEIRRIKIKEDPACAYGECRGTRCGQHTDHHIYRGPRVSKPNSHRRCIDYREPAQGRRYHFYYVHNYRASDGGVILCAEKALDTGCCFMAACRVLPDLDAMHVHVYFYPLLVLAVQPGAFAARMRCRFAFGRTPLLVQYEKYDRSNKRR